VGLVSLNCATVREGLRTIAEGLKTTNTGGAVILDEVGGVALLGYAVIAPGVENADHIIDAGMARLMNVMQDLCGPKWRPDHVFLTRTPPCDVSSFARFFQTSVDFRRGLRAARVRRDDSRLAHQGSASRAPGNSCSAVGESARRSAGRVRVRGQVGPSAQASAGPLTRKRISRAMGLSKHALTSRLKASGVTFAKLADETLLELATSLLIKGRPISEVSAALGFADKSAFTRAFKKWAGAPPGQWRSEHASSRALG
jgi:AraC-like DNA-binding protein